MDFENIVAAKYHAGIEKELSFSLAIYQYMVLPFNMQAQTQSNWCWAATATSVSRFHSLLCGWTQCKVASKELSQTCCTSPVPGACNVPWYLDKALKRTNNFVSMQSGTITWSQIKTQLQNGVVVGARQGWSGGGGHFMVIHGVSRFGTTYYLHIDDPIYGKNVMTYDQFATNYQGSGTWTHTYFTKKHFCLMWFKDLVFDTKLLRPINEARALANTYGDRTRIREDAPEGEYSLPHFSYVVGLDDLKKKSFALPTSASTLRVLEVQDQRPAALYEVGTDEANPTLVQMNVSDAYFEQLNEAIGRLRQSVREKEQPGELRLIKVPALNIEAFWLSYEGREDRIALLKRFENDTTFDWDKVYSAQEFTKALQELASKIDTKDGEIGA